MVVKVHRAVIVYMLILCMFTIQSMNSDNTDMSELAVKSRHFRIEKRDLNESIPDYAYNNETQDYPNNHRITKGQLERFQDYYTCLNDSRIRPMAHYVIPGTSVSLLCTACVSPQKNSIEWRYANRATNLEEKLVDSDQSTNKHSKELRSIQSSDRLTLTLYGLSKADSGNYNCLQDGSVITPHLVQVAEFSENMTQVKPQSAPKGPHPKTVVTLTLHKEVWSVKVWSKWSSWSSCSHCSRVGKRIRIGVCMVSATANSFNADGKIFQIFTEGLPCRSPLLPKKIRNNPAIASRQNEYMVGFCKERCPKKKKYLLKETAGILLRKLGQPGESFALIKKLPYVPPPVKRAVLYLRQFDTAHIQCPGSDHNDAVVIWKMGLNLKLTKSDRIRLTPTHVLVIYDLALSDSNIYSCWQRHRLVGFVHLVVSHPVQVSFEEQISALVLISIIISFIIISLRILRSFIKRRVLRTAK